MPLRFRIAVLRRRIEYWWAGYDWQVSHAYATLDVGTRMIDAAIAKLSRRKDSV